MIRLKDLQKIYKYPQNHQWEDKYKIHCGWVTSSPKYEELGIVWLTDKKEAWEVFKKRVKAKRYRLRHESYNEFEQRIKTIII